MLGKHLIVIKYDHLLVHWASEFSTKSFMEWVRGALFTPMAGVNVEVEDLKHGPIEPAAACSQCKVKWMESGVEALIQATKWDKIRQRSDVEALVGVGMWVCGCDQ